VSLGSLLVYAGFVIQMIVCGERGLFTGADRATLIEMYVIAFFLAALAYWMHRQNIVRLLQGKERKTYLTKKNKVDIE
jgi:glycerol-3-phosphate acyltransferase PlsY